MKICFLYLFLTFKGRKIVFNGRDANGNGDPPDDVADNDANGDRRITDDRTAT